jgi:hypothetical protein
MTKHHHQSRAEQIDNKAHGAPPFHFKKKPGDTSTQIRADQIDDENEVIKISKDDVGDTS